MTGPPPAANGGGPVRTAIDSTVMLVLARFFMPTVVAVLGFFLIDELSNLRSENKEVHAQVGRLGDKQSGLSAKLDALIRQVDRIQIQVDDQHKQRPN